MDPSQPLAQPQTYSNKNSNLLIILTSVLVVVVASVIGILTYITNQSSFSNSTPIKTSSDDSTIQLPIPLNDPRVFRAAISYSLIGIYDRIENKGDKKLILRDNQNLPSLPINSVDTKYYWWDDAQKLSASAKETDLEPNNKLRINVFYSLKRKAWLTHQVFIYTNQIPKGATPTAINE